MRILFFGNGPRGIRCFEALIEAGYQLCGVVSHSRKSELYASATDRGISAFGPGKVNERVFVGGVDALRPDLFVLAGYNQILGSKILEMPRLGAINLHGGKLPEYRGVAPVNWQIINGETTGGCCVLFVDEGIDTGDLIQQSYYEIGEDDTAEDIVKKQLVLFPQMLLAAVRQIDAGSINRCPQDRKRGAYYTRRYAKDKSYRLAPDVVNAGSQPDQGYERTVVSASFLLLSRPEVSGVKIDTATGRYQRVCRKDRFETRRGYGNDRSRPRIASH